MTIITCERRSKIDRNAQWEITKRTTLEELRKSSDASDGFCYYADPWSDIRISFEGSKGVYGVVNFLGGKDHAYGPKHLFLASTQLDDDIKNNVEHVWPHPVILSEDDQGGYILDRESGKKIADPAAENLIKSTGDVNRQQDQFFKKLHENGYMDGEMYEALSLILHPGRNLAKERPQGKKTMMSNIFAWVRRGQRRGS